MKNTKELIGSKFLFDKSLISYADLVELLENEEFNVDFIKKPIKDNLEVHSLYIKPDYEVAYLAKNEKSDEHYKNAGYSCISYKEVTLQDVLDILGWKSPVSDETGKQKKIKQSKFITLVDKDSGAYTFRKNKIDMFVYRNSQLEILYLNAVYYFYMVEEKYNEIKTELMS